MSNDEFLSKYAFRELTENVLAGCEHFSCGIDDLDEKNGFTYLFPSEEIESMCTRKDRAVVPQSTRLMYFDLKDTSE